MSQSNYTDHLRISTILTEQIKLSPVLDCNSYTKYKKYSIINTIPNTKKSFSQLSSSINTNVFGMERNTDRCPKFQLCNNTNKRINRHIHTEQLPIPSKKINKDFIEKICICNR